MSLQNYCVPINLCVKFKLKIFISTINCYKNYTLFSIQERTLGIKTLPLHIYHIIPSYLPSNVLFNVLNGIYYKQNMFTIILHQYLLNITTNTYYYCFKVINNIMIRHDVCPSNKMEKIQIGNIFL